MRTSFHVLRDGEGAGDGNGTGTGVTTPAAAPETVAPSVNSVWGGRAAPDWTKQAGLEKVHDKTNTDAGTPTQVDPLTQGATAKPAVTAPVQAAPVTPTPVAAPVAAPAQMDPAAIARAVTEGVRAAQQQQVDAGKPALTPDQIRQQLGLYEMTADDYKGMFGVDPQSPEQLATANRIFQAVAKNAVTVAALMQQNAMGDLKASMDPYIGVIRAQEAERQQVTFYQESPDLKGYEALVHKEYENLKSSGRKFSSAAEARRAVADQTRATLKAIGITPAAAAQTGVTSTTTTTSPAPATRQMTTTSVGGRGGSSATASKPATSIEAVWGKK
jgi:hypothetical protein